jgi:hypothetical protein
MKKTFEQKNQENIETTNRQQEIKHNDVDDDTALPKRQRRTQNVSREAKTPSTNKLPKSPYYKTRSFFQKNKKTKNQNEEHQEKHHMNDVQPVEVIREVRGIKERTSKGHSSTVSKNSKNRMENFEKNKN